MKKYLFLLFIISQIIFHTQILAAEESQYQQYISKLKKQDKSGKDINNPVYPLYRAHSEQYYPTRSTSKATILSATMPGLGQAYADNYLKAVIFLSAEIGVFSLASYNIARALHYKEHKEFRTGFFDDKSGIFLDRDQVDSRIADHTLRGTLFLITGIGIHVWNILDASKTAENFNNRRISLQMQHTNSGMNALIFTHHF
ncbi:hypothetical protein JT359_12070 [Candidatus Poribacteria bacterium]|nr:hypothetical protein [Candidatus Poribacteria bacterium]